MRKPIGRFELAAALFVIAAVSLPRAGRAGPVSVRMFLSDLDAPIPSTASRRQ